MRRKKLGADRCLHCPESDIWCLESDHPVGEKRDEKFHRPVCRNCHRKRESLRDFHGLTKNGLHKRREPKIERHISYLLLLALDQESIAEALESEHASIPLTVAALKATAASLRRQADKIRLYTPANSSRSTGQPGQKPRRRN